MLGSLQLCAKRVSLMILISESLTSGLHLSKIPSPAPASGNEWTISSEEDVILEKQGDNF
jgi:hypothetical protein